MHTLVKFNNNIHEGEKLDEDQRGWHLLAEIGDGEFTACGLAEPESPSKSKKQEKGGITCKQCLENIRYYKSIKL